MKRPSLKTITLDVRSPADALAEFSNACKTGKTQKAARRAGRDVKAVHGDITALLNAGVLDRTTDRQIVFPFEALKIEFLLQAA